MIISWLVYYFRVRKKYKAGKAEWRENMKAEPNTMCPPWVTELTSDEMEWLNNAHEFYYGPFWYIEDPLGPSQIQSIMFEDVRKKSLITVSVIAVMASIVLAYVLFRR